MTSLKISVHGADPKMLMAMRPFLHSFIENSAGSECYLAADLQIRGDEEISFFSTRYDEPVFYKKDKDEHGRILNNAKEKEQKGSRPETSGPTQPDSEPNVSLS